MVEKFPSDILTHSFKAILTAAIDHLVDNGIINNFSYSYRNGDFLLCFLTSYFVIAKDFNTDQLVSFKAADFANFTTVTIENQLFYRFQDRDLAQKFPIFHASSFEFHIMKVYYTKVRSHWTSGLTRDNVDINSSFLITSNGDAVNGALSNILFSKIKTYIPALNSNYHENTLMKEQEQFNSHLSQIPGFRDPVILRTLLVFNAEKTVVKRILDKPIHFNRRLLNVSCHFRLQTNNNTPSHRRNSILFSSSLTQQERKVVFERCQLQVWPNLSVREDCGADVEGGRKIGRGVVAMSYFRQNEIVLDYHGRRISRKERDEIVQNQNDNDRRSDYIFIGIQGLIIDGSDEICDCHPHVRLLGRLVNHAEMKAPACNIVPRFFRHEDSKKTHTFILFVASRDIEPLEELRYDYNDENCADMFS